MYPSIGGSQIIHHAFERAVGWLIANIDSHGTPADADSRTGWSRLGWGLAIGGRPDAAAAVVTWAERHRIGNDGNYLPGYQEGQGYIALYPHYWLGTFVISAWLAGKQTVARRSMAYLRAQQDPKTGGVPLKGRGDDAVCDVLSTAQVGLSALVTGDHETAARCADWVRALANQSAQDSLIFYSGRRGHDLWTDPEPEYAWAAIADFSVARQAFYTPAMGAVFLARYAGRYGCAASIAAARSLLAFNMNGSSAQFEDLDSVQACKFGWAVAEMALVDPEGGWMPWVDTMIGWYLDRQAPEGWWGPSKFADPNPSIADQMVKTSEHLMELSVCLAARAAAAVP